MKKKPLTALITAVVMTAFCGLTAYASGDVAGAVESTWSTAKSQIVSVVDNVVFPVIDVILAILLFVKVTLAYLDYRKHGQLEWTLIAIIFGCLIFSLTCPLYSGTISPPIQNAVTETTMVSTDSLADSSVLSESDSNTNEEQIRTNTFIAEFFDSGISFADTSKLVTEVMKGCTFESETDSSNGIQKISLKDKNGGGVLNVMCIDLSKSNLSYDMEYILENFGDYYFRQTASQMNCITENDFVSNYRMLNSVLSKGKYQRYSSVQKTDGMASQFGYTETYAVLNENKLTVVSGAYLSTDMMERQSFMQLMVKFAENVKY